MTDTHDIRASFHRLVAAIQRGDVEEAVQHFAEDGVVVDFTAPEAPLVGRTAIAEVLRGYWDLLPDMTFEVTGVIAGEERLSGELVIKGTPVGTTDQVTLRYGVFEQFRNGQIVAEHLYSDSRQLPAGLGA
ncbi:nuclear transport factor 2 family protein [Nocardioides speluncae]|uniref:nuclear transport factor 2 family protein n=1 Tax=Nocardioides speluncae TaxID=2670337 RepID=UPI000D690B38|nr:nuclear transport factor 2 family protein [Nocardioides speluncae]